LAGTKALAYLPAVSVTKEKTFHNTDYKKRSSLFWKNFENKEKKNVFEVGTRMTGIRYLINLFLMASRLFIDWL
jgi:hypothetical protein